MIELEAAIGLSALSMGAGLGGKIVFDWLKNGKGSYVSKDMCKVLHKNLETSFAELSDTQKLQTKTLTKVDKNLALVALKMGVPIDDSN